MNTTKAGVNVAGMPGSTFKQFNYTILIVYYYF